MRGLLFSCPPFTAANTAAFSASLCTSESLYRSVVVRCSVLGLTLRTGLERAIGSPEVVIEAEVEVWTGIWTGTCVSMERGRGEGLDLCRPDGPVMRPAFSVPLLLYPWLTVPLSPLV